MMTEYGEFDRLPPEVQETWLNSVATDKLSVALQAGAVSRDAIVGWRTTAGMISMVVVEVRWVLLDGGGAHYPVPVWKREGHILRALPFPILATPDFKRGVGACSWSDAERAYAVYSQKYSGQSLERLAERGGFSRDELDEYAPGWVELPPQLG